MTHRPDADFSFLVKLLLGSFGFVIFLLMVLLTASVLRNACQQRRITALQSQLGQKSSEASDNPGAQSSEQHQAESGDVTPPPVVSQPILPDTTLPQDSVLPSAEEAQNTVVRPLRRGNSFRQSIRAGPKEDQPQKDSTAKLCSCSSKTLDAQGSSTIVQAATANTVLPEAPAAFTATTDAPGVTAAPVATAAPGVTVPAASYGNAPGLVDPPLSENEWPPSSLRTLGPAWVPQIQQGTNPWSEQEVIEAENRKKWEAAFAGFDSAFSRQDDLGWADRQWSQEGFNTPFMEDSARAFQNHQAQMARFVKWRAGSTNQTLPRRLFKHYPSQHPEFSDAYSSENEAAHYGQNWTGVVPKRKLSAAYSVQSNPFGPTRHLRTSSEAWPFCGRPPTPMRTASLSRARKVESQESHF